MSSIIYFYISVFWIGFLLCIPIGPVNLEIFHTSLKKQYPQAVAVAIGGAIGDAVWAAVAFFGISPFEKPHLEGFFLIGTAVITMCLGIFALKDSKGMEKKDDAVITKIKRKRWAFLKGLTLVLVNPLGIVSWMICLKFLKQMDIYIPMELRYELLYFGVVTLGAVSYFLLVVFITNKMKEFFNPKRTVKITRFLGYLLITLSLYFVYHAVQAFFFK